MTKVGDYVTVDLTKAVRSKSPMVSTSAKHLIKKGHEHVGPLLVVRATGHPYSLRVVENPLLNGHTWEFTPEGKLYRGDDIFPVEVSESLLNNVLKL